MHTSFPSLLVMLGIFCLASPLPAGNSPATFEWPMFRADAARGGHYPLPLSNPPFRRLWTFDLGSHTWNYCQGASVWSSSAVSAQLDGQSRIFVGCYDHNVYCLNANTGEEVWRFTTGCLVKAAPVFARINGKPMLFVASSDRCFYALDARTGRKIWNYETHNWTYTVGESVAGSPLIAEIGGKPVLFATMWNGDRRPLRTTQTGELFAFAPETGELHWKVELSTAHISTPSFMNVKGKPMLFVGGEDGILQARDARDGSKIWQFTTDHRIDGAPLVAKVANVPVVFTANAWGMVRCLNAANKKVLWRYKAGHEILSSPALVKAGDLLLLIVGSSDRCVHAIEAKAGDPVWKYQTGKFVVASPAIATIRGRPAVCINSLDNNLYILDAQVGCEIMRFASDDMLWPYETRGASLWSSPSFAQLDNGKALLLYPAHDGKLYAFTEGSLDQPTAAEDAKLSSWHPKSADRPLTSVKKSHSRASRVIPPLTAGILFLLGLAFLRPRRQKN